MMKIRAPEPSRPCTLVPLSNTLPCLHQRLVLACKRLSTGHAQSALSKCWHCKVHPKGAVEGAAP